MRYEKIRDALAMGLTPGPWELKDGRTDKIENAQGYLVCTVHYHPYERYGHGARAAYIAACDPDTIRALLAERDALREALDGLVGDIESLVAESDGVAGLHLNGALATWAELMPGGRFEWLEHMDKAHAALEQEAGRG